MPRIDHARNPATNAAGRKESERANISSKTFDRYDELKDLRGCSTRTENTSNSTPHTQKAVRVRVRVRVHLKASEQVYHEKEKRAAGEREESMTTCR